MARLFSVVSFFFGILLIYLTALEVDEKRGWLVGLIAASLTMTSQSLLVNSALVMMEAPGLLASFALLWSYLRAMKRPTTGRLVITSLLLALVFLTKYTYGVVAVLTLVLMEFTRIAPAQSGEASEAARSHRLTRRWLSLFGPFAALMLIWFAGTGKIASFIAYATSQPPGQPWLTAENLLFYPRSIALHHTPAPLFALIMLVSLLWAVTRWRDESVRLLLIYFAVGLLVMVINLPKDSRFIATFVPAAHILTGLFVVQLVALLRGREARQRIMALVALVAIAAAGLVSFPILLDRFVLYPSLLEVEYETDPRADEMAGWIAAHVPAEARLYLLNGWDQFSHQAISWYLGAHDRPVHPRSLHVSASLVEPASVTNIAALRHEILQSGASYVVLLEGGAWGHPFWPDYTVAMQDILVPVGRKSFKLELSDGGEAWDEALLRRDEWQQMRARSRYTLDITVIIYQLDPLIQ